MQKISKLFENGNFCDKLKKLAQEHICYDIFVAQYQNSNSNSVSSILFNAAGRKYKFRKQLITLILKVEKYDTFGSIVWGSDPRVNMC